MNDLTALVLILRAPKLLTTPAHLGRAAYALLLRLLDAADPELAHALHSSNGPKPFTCTTLVGGRRQNRETRLYTPDETAWLRFTGLNEELSDHLRRLAETPPLKVDLDGCIFKVEKATLNGAEHPWAGESSYEALAAPHLLARETPHYRLRLEMVSPTTFRSGGYSHPVPMPGWLFGSLMDRWNAFSPVQIAEETRRYAQECVILSRYRLRTRAVPLKDNIVQVGCVGEAQYQLLNRDKYWANLLNMLPDYAFYSGIGYQTTVGMGQARATAL